MPEWNWQGDTDSHCTLEVGDYSASCELMGDSWYIEVDSGNVWLFASEFGATGKVHGGDMARYICESIIAAALGMGPAR